MRAPPKLPQRLARDPLQSCFVRIRRDTGSPASRIAAGAARPCLLPRHAALRLLALSARPTLAPGAVGLLPKQVIECLLAVGIPTSRILRSDEVFDLRGEPGAYRINTGCCLERGPIERVECGDLVLLQGSGHVAPIFVAPIADLLIVRQLRNLLTLGFIAPRLLAGVNPRLRLLRSKAAKLTLLSLYPLSQLAEFRGLSLASSRPALLPLRFRDLLGVGIRLVGFRRLIRLILDNLFLEIVDRLFIR